jgi:tRNA 2-thiouridine synthesizing protein E
MAKAEKFEILCKSLSADSDGSLVNSMDWNEDVAEELAKEFGIAELTAEHWQVIKYVRKVFAETGESPSIRKLTKESGLDSNSLYSLFPGGPAKKAARLAGLPKPKGCI